MSYEKDHVTYDEQGLLYVHCMACNNIVRQRAEVPSKMDPKRMLMIMMTLNTYREREVELSDGSLAYLIYCSDCINLPVEPTKAMDMAKRGWEIELQKAGRPQVAIDRMKRDKKDLAIVKINHSLTEFDRIEKADAVDNAAQVAAEVKGP